MMLIPAIDLIGGRCVRLEQGDFQRRTLYDFDPVELACRYAEAGAKYLHLVDLDGAKSGAPRQLALIAEIVTACGIPVQCGGGLRTRADLDAALQTGVARLVVGSALIRSHSTGSQWLAELGQERVVAALDARPVGDGYELMVSGWQQASGQSLFDAMALWRTSGLKHALITDIARDGKMAGPSVALYQSIIESFPELNLQASGGIRNVDDLKQLQAIGAGGAIVGKALLDGSMNLDQALET